MNKKCSRPDLSSQPHNRQSNAQSQKWVGLVVTVVALVVCGPEAQAQQAKRVFHMGYLSGGSAAARDTRFALALRELGYVEGQNTVIEYRYAEGQLDRLPALAAELVRLNVDIVVAAGADTVARAAKNATKTIPIVMSGQGIDPVEAALVENLAHPGGNVTGLTNLTGELGGKRLELFKQAVPKLARVAALYNPAALGSAHQLKEISRLRRAIGLTIQLWEVRDADAFERVFAAMNKQHPDGLYVLGGTVMRVNEKQIVEFALKSRIPSMYFTREFVDAGGLMSYGADRVDSDRRIAYFVDKILKGAKPADLPIERPTKFEFIINLKTAKQIGVTIPWNVLARADSVIR
jgi:putative tryptophan/tyrosine transport system substrate-binding protein